MREERVDVCIVGSGAGGGLIAHEAAKRKLSTLVLERGREMPGGEVDGDELSVIPRFYKDGGLQMNTTHDLFILQGVCVGGSTELSNMVLLPADREVFAEWRALGLPFGQQEIEAAHAAVSAELGATTPKSQAVSRSARLFFEGARAVGRDPAFMLKALGDCKACGLCNIGCPFGTKRSSRFTYLAWAASLGARVIPEADVVLLRHRKGHVDCIEANVGRRGERLRVRAKLFVIAAGAIGSSALLLRSGIKKNVGTRLSMNAGAMMVAEFDDVIDGFDADQMTVYLRDSDWLIECTHNPLMSAALTTPGWFEDHGQLMSRTRHLAYAGGMVGSAPVGQVFLSYFTGREEVSFQLCPADLQKLKDALAMIARVFFAAGASRVLLPTHRFTELRSVEDLPMVSERVTSQRSISLGSAHPQGGNPLATDPDLGVVGADFTVHGFDNLGIFDASVFPTSVRVNPIHTILSLGKCVAPRLLAHA